MERLYGFIGEIGDKNRCFALIDEPWNNLPATWVKKRLEAKQSNEYKKKKKEISKEIWRREPTNDEFSHLLYVFVMRCMYSP